MNKIIIDKPKVFTTETCQKPSVQNNEVLIKVSRISLCGSDIHLYNGTYSGPINYPIMFGHEWSGVVAETGAKVTKFKKGDKVIKLPEIVPAIVRIVNTVKSIKIFVSILKNME
jgi:threonine dehydrogenase-like Zn-dependent dehydrogenase